MAFGKLASRIFAVTGVLALAVAALGYSFIDSDIKFIKGNGSPTLAVKYSGAKAARIELKVNGVTVATRNLSASKSSGLVPFGIRSEDLRPGENLVETVLYDAAGKVLGTEKTTVATSNGDIPIFVKSPKMGDSVQGPVEIHVGFKMDMREAYVSFFVDREFRSMKNVPPYAYLWDTTTETNGWHEVEAWTFDATQTTRKSQPIRVYVNNPGGRTDRMTQEPKTIAPKAKPVAIAAPKVAVPVGTPSLSSVPSRVAVGKPSGLKGTDALYAESTGFRVSTPKAAMNLNTTSAKASVKAAGGAPAKLIAKPAAIAATKIQPVRPKAVTKGTVKVERGVRLPNGKFSISFEGQELSFDVSPRVASGVPLTPFRHLFEGAGGKVDWQNLEKVCTGTGLGYEIWLKIGDVFAKVNGQEVQLEAVPFLEKGRTIVPLSFVDSALGMNVEYDQASGHVLITAKKKA